MIANDYQLEFAKAELAKLRDSLADLENVLATLPQSIAAQVKAHRPATIRRRILELEEEIRQYAKTQHTLMVTTPHS